jgi:hypothetical protein
VDGNDLGPKDVFIGVSFSQEMRALMDSSMRKYGVTWADFVEVGIPEWSQYPYMVRFVFRHRTVDEGSVEITHEAGTNIVEVTATGRVFWHEKGEGEE